MLRSHAVVVHLASMCTYTFQCDDHMFRHIKILNVGDNLRGARQRQPKAPRRRARKCGCQRAEHVACVHLTGVSFCLSRLVMSCALCMPCPSPCHVHLQPLLPSGLVQVLIDMHVKDLTCHAHAT